MKLPIKRFLFFCSILVLLIPILYFNMFLVKSITTAFDPLYNKLELLDESICSLNDEMKFMGDLLELSSEFISSNGNDRLVIFEIIKSKYTLSYASLEEKTHEIDLRTGIIEHELNIFYPAFTSKFKENKYIFMDELNAIIHQNQDIRHSLLQYEERLSSSETLDLSAFQTLQSQLLPITSNLNGLFINLFTISLDIHQFITSLIIIFLFLLTVILIYLTLHFITIYDAYIRKGLKKITSFDFNINDFKLKKILFREEENINQFVQNIFKEHTYINDVRIIATKGHIIEDVLENIFIYISKKYSYIDRLGIAFVDHDKQVFVTEYGIANYNNLTIDIGYSTQFHETSLTELLSSKDILINNDLLSELEKKPNSKQLKDIIFEGILSNMIIPLITNNQVFAILFLSSKEKNPFKPQHVQLIKQMVRNSAELLEKNYLIKITFTQLTNIFAILVDKKDYETGGHLQRMVLYSTAVTRSLLKKNLAHHDYTINNSYLLDIQKNAAIHDIGKISIPDSILKNPGKLNENEWTIMKTHTIIGGEIFRNLRNSFKIFDNNYFKIAEEIATHHHEQWNGSGYPDGLSGYAIPLSARIIAIADVFDALTSKRRYKDAFSFEDSVKIIRESSGKHFDPIIVDCFNHCIEEIHCIYLNNYSP